jgi:WD40 repeat protein
VEVREIERFQAGAAWVEQLVWSPDGSVLAAGAGKGVVLWRAQGGIFHKFLEHRSTVAALAWWRDGSRIAAACYGGVSVYDPGAGDLLEVLPWKTSLLSLAVSPDHRWVVSGTQEMSVQIWPLPFVEGEELAMSGYAGKVRDLSWHHSGRYLATGGGEEIMVWDCGGRGPAGSTPRILEGHLGRVSALAYQSRGHVLASGGQDGLIFFWNAGKSSQALRQIRLTGAVTALAWTPDDLKVLAGTQDGRLALASTPV